MVGVVGARQLALPGGAKQLPLHAPVAEERPSSGRARRRQAADDNLLSMACGTDAAPDRAPTVHVLISIARGREVQPLPHRCSLNPARLSHNACALARATLAAPLLSALISRFGPLSPFTGCIERMSEAERAVGARRLARSWFAMRAGGGRGMCNSVVPP